MGSSLIEDVLVATGQALATVGITLGITLGIITLALLAIPGSNKPNLLVGYGCEGSNGQPMYYTEEDHFPPCSLIESAR